MEDEHARTDADWVERLHAVVDEVAAPVASANAERLACRRGCSDCCTDGLTVFAIEAAVIRRRHPELLERGAPHPAGGCAFLDAEGGCRIYESRPYVCRTQGLPLRWLTDDADTDEIVECRDICPKNVDGGPPLEELAPEACFPLGPFEQRLADRQRATSERGGRGDQRAERVELRRLFATEAASPRPRRLVVVPG